jgi:NADH-quinone oxidoreductase subunit C
MTEITPAPRPPADGEVVEVNHGMFGVHDAGDTTGFGGLVTDVVFSPASARPYGGWFDEAVDTLTARLAEAGAEDAIEKVVVDRGELTVFIHRDALVRAFQILRDDPALRFELTLGVSGAHYPGDAGRELHAVYHLLSLTHGSRLIRVEVTTADGDGHIPSTLSVYPAHDWHERETYDMFGIVFDGHPSLARILMPNDWIGFPQRKDYPLGGVNVQFDGATTPPADKRRRYF